MIALPTVVALAVRTAQEHAAHAVVGSLLGTVFVSYLGLRRFRDPLVHEDAHRSWKRDVCPHTPSCGFYDPALAEPELTPAPKLRSILLPGSTTPIVIEEEAKRKTPAFGRRLWFYRLSLRDRLVCLVVGFIIAAVLVALVFPVVIWVGWEVGSLWVRRAQCHCRHLDGCRLSERNWSLRSGANPGCSDSVAVGPVTTARGKGGVRGFGGGRLFRRNKSSPSLSVERVFSTLRTPLETPSRLPPVLRRRLSLA